LVELLAAGGCYNSNRWAKSGAGVGARNWKAAVNADAEMTDISQAILACCIDADDMNNATSATFKIQWRNVTDAGSFADLAATGEIKWSTTSDLVDGATVTSAEDSGGNLNCTGKGWSRRDGIEVEGKNGITHTVNQDAYEDLQWAIDLTSADGTNGDQYEFRLCESGGTVIGTCVGKLTVVKAGKIDGVTKNADRSAVVGGVTVSAFRSDEAGTNPKPINILRAQVVSDASTGAYSLPDLISGAKYFLHFYKDDTNDLSDGSPEVTAVDA